MNGIISSVFLLICLTQQVFSQQALYAQCGGNLDEFL